VNATDVTLLRAWARRLLAPLRGSLGAKFLVLIVTVLVVILGIKGALGYHAEVEQLNARLVSKGESLGRFLASISAPPILSYDLITLDEYVREVTRDQDVVYALIESLDGTAFTRHLDRAKPAIAPLAPEEQAGVQAAAAALRRQSQMLNLEFPVLMGARELGRVRLGLSREYVLAAARRELVRELGGSLAAILVLGLCIYVVFRYSALRPIQSLIHGSRRVAAGDLEQEVSVGSGDELGQLAFTFNEMMRSLLRSAQEKDRILGYVHEINKSLEHRVEERTHELALLNRDLEHLALHDPLTDLPNRTLIQDRLDLEIRASQRTNSHFAVIMMDLDGFKEINDTLGHHVGDQLLVAVSKRLGQSLRAADTIGRLGGDEYAILLPDADAPQAVLVARNLMRVLSPAVALEDVRLTISASMGIAIYPVHGDDRATLLRRADAAMYVAKHERTGYCLYDARHDHNNQPDRLALITELAEAIRGRDLQLYYQPILSLEEEEIVGVEALARWPKARNLAISQEVLINLVEQTELIGPFTSWLFDTVARQWAEWAAHGRDLRISVNLCMRNVLDPGLRVLVSEALRRHGMRPECLVIEITESTVMRDPERVRRTLRELTDMGIRIAIDDFGMGYSSFSHLSRMPLNELKIDQSFLKNLAISRLDQSIVQSIVDLAHNLNLSVVAEGVEGPEVLPILKRWNCEFAQGYYLGEPVPPEQLTPYLMTRCVLRSWKHRAAS
jgi:diguanylate cyclase (GGDEF)-like protein